jgi:hypothetical protein
LLYWVYNPEKQDLWRPLFMFATLFRTIEF